MPQTDIETPEDIKQPALVEKPALVEPPAVIEKPAAVEPPAVVEKPAAVEPPAVEPPAVVEKPAAVEPPPVVEKPAAVEPPAVEPPAVVEKPAAVEPPPVVEKPAAAAEPPPVVEKPAIIAPPSIVGPPGPILTAARPSTVSVKGGSSVSLYGANFADGCRVLVGGIDTTSPRLTDEDSTLVIQAPPRPAGPASVIVENPDGQRATIEINYDEGPTIDRFSPLEGSPDGGTEIVVEGRNLQEGCRITFFGDYAPEVAYTGPGRVQFKTPPQDERFHGEVRITNPDGLFTVADEHFTYRLATPIVSGVSPSTGLVGGGKRISVKGADFHPKCAARLGGQPASVTWKGSGTIELATPRAAGPGAVALEIENPDGQVVTLEGAFTYEAEPTPPLLVEVRPGRGFCEGGQVIRLWGDNFEEDTIVRIGEVRAVSRFISRNEIDVELPPRPEAGIVAVELKDRHGIVVRREDGFSYELRQAPRVESVTPRNGPMVGGTKILIEGEHFDDKTFVRIGGQSPKRATLRGTTIIELYTPPSRAAGLVDVEVIRPGAGSGVSKSGFRYDASPAPQIVSVSPSKGSTSGGTELSIEGKNFVADSVVLFGRAPAPRVKFVSASTLEVKTPPGKNGEMVDVTVRNPDGKDAVSKRAFVYDERYRG